MLMEWRYIMENIKCPNCGHEIPIEDALLHKSEEKIRLEYEKKFNEQAAFVNKQKSELEKQSKALEEKAEEQERNLKKLVENGIREQQSRLEKEASEKFEAQIKQLAEENAKRKAENLELKKHELSLMKMEEELKEKEERLQIDLQKSLLEKQEEIKQNAVAQEKEKNELLIREYEKKLGDQKLLIEEMKRKAEQGSMQMQGEVQELALEELLKSQFPFDDIQPVPKGVSGADIIQHVKNEFQQDCGQIIYESKRTKAFSEGWIDKLKEDAMSTGANLSVIVTEALPKDMVRFGRKQGVWICTFNEVQSVTFALREMLLKEHAALLSVSNRSDKMELLYQYLTSDNFRQRIEGIVEGFASMKEQIEQEKRAMQRIWKEREKQIEKVINNTINMYGSIRGIAGNAVGTVKALELEFIGDGQEDSIA
jgi:hypothetical protein